MRRTAIMLAGVITLLSLGATAQENRSEISVPGTGFFTQDTNGQGISRTTTETGGFLVGYRYQFNRWLSGEANYATTKTPRGIFLQVGFLEFNPMCTRFFPGCRGVFGRRREFG
jgi:hypothetical protein